MHARSLYLDASVIGGYFDPEFMADTHALWRLREAGRFRFITSQLVFQEIVGAPERVRNLMRATFEPELLCRDRLKKEEKSPNPLLQWRVCIPRIKLAAKERKTAFPFSTRGTVTLDFQGKMCLYYSMRSTTVLTIKQLHDDTGPLVRRAGASKRPVPVTDRGQEVAVITNRSLLRPTVRKRTLLPEYEAMMAEAPRDDIQAALDEDRGTR